MIRSSAAVLTGLAVAIVLLMILGFLTAAALGISPVGPATRASVAANLVSAAIAGASGGAIAVRLAPHTPHGHVGILALLILLLSLPTLLAPPGAGEPAWYGLAQSVLGPVSVALGGFLAVRQLDRGLPAR